LIFHLVGLSQGQFYLKGQSGIGFGAGVNFPENAMDYLGSVSYTFGGRATILGLIGTTRSTEDDLSSFNIGANVIFYPYKYSQSKPITMELAIGYMHSNYSDEVLSEFDLKLTGGALTLEGGFYYHIFIKELNQLIPWVKYEYNYTKAELSDGYGNYADDDITAWYYLKMGLYLSVSTSDKLDILVGPMIIMGVKGEGNDNITFNKL
jgi:hypothetical protein